jgi:hypothetical protein
MVNVEHDREYLDLLVKPIRVCGSYTPKLGHGRDSGMSLEAFQTLYRADPFYSWFGLDHPLMYAAHKAAGGMTSVYRQIGIGCERLFRRVLQDQLALDDADVVWSYSVKGANTKTRTLKLDARIPLEKLDDGPTRRRVESWMYAAAADLHVSRGIVDALKGIVFEVRQGYKSKDSKRQNADIANAATAYAQAYLPCVVVLSTQIDDDIYSRYREEQWVILRGQTGRVTATESTYRFMNDVVGYDLAGFFERNSVALKREIALVLEALLQPE